MNCFKVIGSSSKERDKLVSLYHIKVHFQIKVSIFNNHLQIYLIIMCNRYHCKMIEFRYWIVRLLKSKITLRLSLIYKIEVNKYQEENTILIGVHLAELLDIMREIEYQLSIKMNILLPEIDFNQWIPTLILYW